MAKVYHSSTLGPIPLSFTGRRLMQNLLVAIREMADKAVWNAPGFYGLAWDPVSRARGELARYISQLEARKEPSTPIARNTVFQLPPVPAGYVLEAVGDLVVMKPIQNIKRKKAPKRAKSSRRKR
jgi:hypothetical protein